MIEVKIIAASLHAKGDVNPLITIHARYPRFIHSEVMTHRVFSRNARSSRAVPVSKIIEEVETNPVIPWHWHKNQPGMQGFIEHNNSVKYFSDYSIFDDKREDAWLGARDQALKFAKAFMEAGYHKQIVNRLLEPFMWIDTLITSTEWDNFFELRLDETTEPHFRDLARAIKNKFQDIDFEQLDFNQWHLPYVTQREKESLDIETQLKISAARCARISYKPFDGGFDIEKEIIRYEKLIESNPPHCSPIEHQAKVVNHDTFSNLASGWLQFRKYKGL